MKKTKTKERFKTLAEVNEYFMAVDSPLTDALIFLSKQIYFLKQNLENTQDKIDQQGVCIDDLYDKVTQSEHDIAFLLDRDGFKKVPMPKEVAAWGEKFESLAQRSKEDPFKKKERKKK